MIDRYYIGYTIGSIEVRVEKHLSNFYPNKYTAQVKDWQLYLQIKCETNNRARQIENHLKKMKSRKYITDLIKYPEMIINLLNKYT